MTPNAAILRKLVSNNQMPCDGVERMCIFEKYGKYKEFNGINKG